MLIYVEGIDKAGKSTLIRKISQNFSIKSFRKNPPENLHPSEYHTFFKGFGYGLMQLSNHLENDLIVDRSFISDWVYSNREKAYLPISNWEDWEKMHGKMGIKVLILYIEISEDCFRTRITAEADPFMGIEDFQIFTHLYDFYLKNTSFKIIRIPGNTSYFNQLNIIRSGIITHQLEETFFGKKILSID